MIATSDRAALGIHKKECQPWKTLLGEGNHIVIDSSDAESNAALPAAESSSVVTVDALPAYAPSLPASAADVSETHPPMTMRRVAFVQNTLRGGPLTTRQLVGLMADIRSRDDDLLAGVESVVVTGDALPACAPTLPGVPLLDSGDDELPAYNRRRCGPGHAPQDRMPSIAQASAEVDAKAAAKAAAEAADDRDIAEAIAAAQEADDAAAQAAGGDDGVKMDFGDVRDANPVRDNAPHADHAVGQSRGDEPEAGTLDEDASSMVNEDEPVTVERETTPGFIHCEDDIPGLTAFPPTPVYNAKKAINYAYTKEFINVAWAAAMAETDFCKKQKHGDLTWSEVLEIFIRRADRIEKGVGRINVAWWESDGIGLSGRRYSGIYGAKPDNLPSFERTTPQGFCCLSPFALPRVLKYILRCETGAVDIDLRLAHYQMQLRRLSKAGKLDMAKCTKKLFQDRASFEQDLANSEWGKEKSKKDIKTLLHCLLYDGVVPEGVPDSVLELAVEQKAIREFDGQKNPDLLKKCQGRRNPLATLQYFLNEAEERAVLDIIVEAGALKKLAPWAFEHDGLVGDHRWKKIKMHMEGEGIELTEKAIPSDWSELRALIVAEMGEDAGLPPVLAKASQGDIEVIQNDPLARALASCGRTLSNNIDHEAFARLVISKVDKNFLLESEAKENVTVQWWDEDRKVWVKAGGGRRLQTKVIDVCRKHARQLGANGEREKPYTYYGNRNFFAPVCDIVKSYLPTAGEQPRLDGDQSRGLLRFSCGTVLDLRTGQTRAARPEDRISKSTGYKYSRWNAPSTLRDAIAQVVNSVVKEWEKKAVPSIDANMFLVTKLTAIKTKSKLLEILFELVGTWDLTLWLLCQITRAIGALPRFEEFLWLSAVSGNNGKGTLVCLLMAVLGANADGYYAQLEFEKHFLGTGCGRYNVNSPDIAELEGKRMVVVNETPGLKGGGELNTGLIKRLLSLDAQINSTAKYKDPTAWTSMMHLLFLANQSPNFGTDPALYTRLSYLFLPFHFADQVDPKNKNHKQIDTNVKPIVQSGVYNSELLFWACQLTPYLMRACSSRKIQPQPANVVEDTRSHAVAAEASITEDTNTKNIAKDFVDTQLIAWKKEAGGPPSTRPEVDAAFCQFAKRRIGYHLNVPNPQESLTKFLKNHDGSTRLKVNFMGHPYAIYRCETTNAIMTVAKDGGAIADAQVAIATAVADVTIAVAASEDADVTAEVAIATVEVTIAAAASDECTTDWF